MSQASRAAEQQTAQRGLVAELVADMADLWLIIRLGAFATTVPQWVAAVELLIRQYASMSATLAADYYDDERGRADVRGTFVFPTPDPPLQDKVTASLRWATKDLWIPEQESPPAIERRLRLAEGKAEGAAQKIVLDASREAIRDAVEQDQTAIGYARVASPNACSFCRVMVIRGAVYDSEESVGRDANDQFTGGGEFKFHDHCVCGVLPIFQGQVWEPPPDVAAWRELYAESTRGERDQLNAFRRAVEGR